MDPLDLSDQLARRSAELRARPACSGGGSRPGVPGETARNGAGREREQRRRRADAHGAAAEVHDQAAVLHERLAGLFEQHDRPGEAVRERDMAAREAELAVAARAKAAAEEDG